MLCLLLCAVVPMCDRKRSGRKWSYWQCKNHSEMTYQQEDKVNDHSSPKAEVGPVAGVTEARSHLWTRGDRKGRREVVSERGANLNLYSWRQRQHFTFCQHNKLNRQTAHDRLTLVNRRKHFVPRREANGGNSTAHSVTRDRQSWVVWKSLQKSASAWLEENEALCRHVFSHNQYITAVYPSSSSVTSLQRTPPNYLVGARWLDHSPIHSLTHSLVISSCPGPELPERGQNVRDLGRFDRPAIWWQKNFSKKNNLTVST